MSKGLAAAFGVWRSRAFARGRHLGLWLPLCFAVWVGGASPARAVPADVDPSDTNRRFIVVNLDAGSLQVHPSWDFQQMGRLAGGIGWFNGRRIIGVQAEAGAHIGPSYSLGLGAEYSSVRTGLSGGVAVMRNLTAEAFGARAELGLSVVRLQAVAFADGRDTRQLSLFVRIPIGLIVAVLTGRV